MQSRIPISHLYEYYIDGALTFKGDVLVSACACRLHRCGEADTNTCLNAQDILDNHRDEFVNYKLSYDVVMFLIKQFIGPMSSSFKGLMATKKEIAAHYDRGNDFFRAFLGPRMVYTSGVYYDCPKWEPSKNGKPAKHIGGTKLEEAQDNKMSLICDRLQLKPGQEYLDIGCGWGTLMRHAAREYGVNSTGVTLAKEGAKWCNDNIKSEGIQDKAQILCMDYREIPEKKYHAISAIEMAEHVGIANFQLFLGNIYENLEDDGYFLMQVSGVLRASRVKQPFRRQLWNWIRPIFPLA